MPMGGCVCSLRGLGIPLTVVVNVCDPAEGYADQGLGDWGDYSVGGRRGLFTRPHGMGWDGCWTSGG